MTVDSAMVEAQLRALGDAVYERYKNGKVLGNLPDIMRPDETIRAITAGTISKRGWLVVLTDQRLLMLTKGLLFSKFKYDQIPLEYVEGVFHMPGMMFDKVQLNVRSKPLVITVLIKDDAPVFTDAVIELIRVDEACEEEDEQVAGETE